jgi:hypothetical protein
MDPTGCEKFLMVTTADKRMAEGTGTGLKNCFERHGFSEMEKAFRGNRECQGRMLL